MLIIIEQGDGDSSLNWLERPIYQYFFMVVLGVSITTAPKMK